MTLEIHDLDLDDEATFAAWYRVYLLAETHELGSYATAWQPEEIRVAMRDGGSHSWTGGWWAEHDGEVAVAGWMRTPLLDNLELAEVMVHVLPDHRRRGLGSAMLAHVESVAASRDRRVMNGLPGWPSSAGPSGTGASGPSFARACGYELALTEVQRELALPVDPAALARLADEAALAHPSYEIRA